MPYIHFTDEQKRQANTVDLVEFLRFKGKPLIRSGSEFRMSSNHSVTIGGNEWYDHAAEKGGGPVSFLKEFYGMNYQQAVLTLLGQDTGQLYHQADTPREKVKKEFTLPPANENNRRAFAYLLKHRPTWTGTYSPPLSGWDWSMRTRVTTTPYSWAKTRTAQPIMPISAAPTARASPSA